MEVVTVEEGADNEGEKSSHSNSSISGSEGSSVVDPMLVNLTEFGSISSVAGEGVQMSKHESEVVVEQTLESELETQQQYKDTDKSSSDSDLDSSSSASESSTEAELEPSRLGRESSTLTKSKVSMVHRLP